LQAPKESRPIFHLGIWSLRSHQENADRRGRPTWRSDESLSPPPFRRDKSGLARDGGVLAQEHVAPLFSVPQNPNFPFPRTVRTEYPFKAVPGTAGEARQSDLHGCRTRRALSPPRRPTMTLRTVERAVQSRPEKQRHLTVDTLPLAPGHFLTADTPTHYAFLRMTQFTTSRRTGPRVSESRCIPPSLCN
jgi:hypothetical protein